MARHIQRLHIEAYRGIVNLSLEELGDINILVGDNNSGKTSVLESLLLLSRPMDFNNVISVSRKRDSYRNLIRFGPDLYESFIYMFNPRNNEMQIAISGEVCHKKVEMLLKGNIEKMLVDIDEIIRQSPYLNERIKEGILSDGEEIEGFVGEISYFIESAQVSLLGNDLITEPVYFHKYIKRIGLNKTQPIIDMHFISTVDHILDNTFRNITRNRNVTEEVVQILKIFDEGIIDLRIAQNDEGRYVQMIEHKSLGSMPISTYGDGIKKVIALANAIVGARNGVLLIDEIETSIHKSAMKKIFSWLVDACEKFDVQLFLTTHSLEAVDELLNSDKSILDNNMVKVITLVKKNEQTVARILSAEKALQAREDYNMELRK